MNLGKGLPHAKLDTRRLKEILGIFLMLVDNYRQVGNIPVDVSTWVLYPVPDTTDKPRAACVHEAKGKRGALRRRNLLAFLFADILHDRNQVAGKVLCDKDIDFLANEGVLQVDTAVTTRQKLDGIFMPALAFDPLLGECGAVVTAKAKLSSSDKQGFDPSCPVGKQVVIGNRLIMGGSIAQFRHGQVMFDKQGLRLFGCGCCFGLIRIVCS